MNSATYKIRLFNKDFKQDNVILAIHCPLEVFYLSVKESQLKDIPEELRKDYIITESDCYNNGGYYQLTEEIFSDLDHLFRAENFKEFCYMSYSYTANGFDEEFECNLIGRYSLIKIDEESGFALNNGHIVPANLEADIKLDNEEVCDAKEI